jgi:adenine-specific DNA glycosylase
MEELLLLPGVGRKIANLLLGDVFGKGAIVCDTHFIRILGRLGMYSEKLKDATKIEFIMRELMDVSEGSDFCHRIVTFGREICTARSPMCESCPLADICFKYKKESAASIPNDTFSTADLDYWFSNTYLLYPRKVNKVKSKEAYEHKIRGLTRNEAKDKANAIFFAVKKQVALWKRENDYEGRKLEHIPYFSSWLNANIEDSPNYKKGRNK